MTDAKKVEFLRGTLDLLVLKALAWGPRHGYAIAKWVRSSSGEALELEDRALYIALHRLEAQKLIRGRWKVLETGRRARIYELTPAGRKQLKEELANWKQYATVMARVLRARFSEES